MLHLLSFLFTLQLHDDHNYYIKLAGSDELYLGEKDNQIVLINGAELNNFESLYINFLRVTDESYRIKLQNKFLSVQNMCKGVGILDESSDVQTLWEFHKTKNGYKLYNRSKNYYVDTVKLYGNACKKLECKQFDTLDAPMVFVFIDCGRVQNTQPKNVKLVFGDLGYNQNPEKNKTLTTLNKKRYKIRNFSKSASAKKRRKKRRYKKVISDSTSSLSTESNELTDTYQHAKNILEEKSKKVFRKIIRNTDKFKTDEQRFRNVVKEIPEKISENSTNAADVPPEKYISIGSVLGDVVKNNTSWMRMIGNKISDLYQMISPTPQDMVKHPLQSTVMDENKTSLLKASPIENSVVNIRSNNNQYEKDLSNYRDSLILPRTNTYENNQLQNYSLQTKKSTINNILTDINMNRSLGTSVIDNKDANSLLFPNNLNFYDSNDPHTVKPFTNNKSTNELATLNNLLISACKNINAMNQVEFNKYGEEPKKQDILSIQINKPKPLETQITNNPNINDLINLNNLSTSINTSNPLETQIANNRDIYELINLNNLSTLSNEPKPLETQIPNNQDIDKVIKQNDIFLSDYNNNYLAKSQTKNEQNDNNIFDLNSIINSSNLNGTTENNQDNNICLESKCVSCPLSQNKSLEDFNKDYNDILELSNLANTLFNSLPTEKLLEEGMGSDEIDNSNVYKSSASKDKVTKINNDESSSSDEMAKKDEQKSTLPKVKSIKTQDEDSSSSDETTKPSELKCSNAENKNTQTKDNVKGSKNTKNNQTINSTKNDDENKSNKNKTSIQSNLVKMVFHDLAEKDELSDDKDTDEKAKSVNTEDKPKLTNTKPEEKKIFGDITVDSLISKMETEKNMLKFYNKKFKNPKHKKVKDHTNKSKVNSKAHTNKQEEGCPYQDYKTVKHKPSMFQQYKRSKASENNKKSVKKETSTKKRKNENSSDIVTFNEHKKTIESTEKINLNDITSKKKIDIPDDMHSFKIEPSRKKKNYLNQSTIDNDDCNESKLKSKLSFVTKNSRCKRKTISTNNRKSKNKLNVTTSLLGKYSDYARLSKLNVSNLGHNTKNMRDKNKQKKNDISYMNIESKKNECDEK